jgi:hypothetical protein
MKMSEMSAAARVELIDPRPQRPSYRHLLHLSVAVVQSFFNRLANTGRAWTVGETTIDVISGVDEYAIGAINIGKILDVVYFDPLNQEGTERQVPFSDLTELPGDYRDSGLTGAARMAFYRKDGFDVPYAKIRPIPNESLTYTVLYSLGTWSQDASLSDSPLLSQHHHLLVAQLARDALPAAEWSGDPKADDYKRQSLERSLSRRIDGYEREFRQYIASLGTPRNSYREEAFAIE